MPPMLSCKHSYYQSFSSCLSHLLTADHMLLLLLLMQVEAAADAVMIINDQDMQEVRHACHNIGQHTVC